MRRKTPRFLYLNSILALMCLAGCADPDPIRQYTVAKPVAPDEVANSSPPSSTPSQQRPVAWFFKILGPDDAVVAQAESFTQLIKTVQFGPDGNPRWSLPSGWTERPETGMRFSTLTIPGTPALEVSVMALPSTDLLSNVNRWRGQLGLPDLSGPEGLEKARTDHELAQLEAGGRQVTLVNLAGQTKDHGPSRMLAAMLPGPSSAATPPVASATTPREAPPSSPADKPFTYTTPAGWKDAPLRTFQQAAFSVEEGGEKLAISIATAGGDLTGNVNRWRKQVGLSDQTAEEITASTKPLTVDGQAAKYYVVEGETDSILGVIAPREGTQWFIKANGPKTIATKERANFEAFVQSLKFN